MSKSEILEKLQGQSADSDLEITKTKLLFIKLDHAIDRS